MQRLFASCSRVLWNCREACSAAQEAFAEHCEARFTTLANGYDEADFSQVQQRPSSRYRLTHVGFLHAAKGLKVRRRPGWLRALGGELRPVDFLARSHFYLLQALARVAARHPEWRQRWELRLMGPASREDLDLIEKSGLGDHVHVSGYVDHEKAVQEMVDADRLFLPHHGLPRGFRARTVPGKTYEYLRSRRPILAALPEGDARDLMARSGDHVVLSAEDVTSMAEALEQDMRRFFEQGRAPDLDPLPGLEAFERRALTMRLADEYSALLSDASTALRSRDA